MSENHWFDEALKILGWILISSIVFTVLMGTPGGLALLAVVAFVFAVNFAIALVVRIAEDVTGAGWVILKAVSRIRIRLPARPPTKREVGRWLVGDFQENEQILEETPLDSYERTAGKRRNKSKLIENLDNLFFGEDE